MNMRVEVFQTSDGTWYLQSFCTKSELVYMLMPFERLVDAIDAASALQLRIDNELPLNQYLKREDTDEVWELVA
jgi:hypothetical protein